MDTLKKCGSCKQGKPRSEFNKDQTKKDGLASICRSCANGIGKSHYQQNKRRYKDKSAERNRRVRFEVRVRMLHYLADHPCVDCGEKDPVVLEFDHRHRDDKTMPVSTMMNRANSWSRVLKEIEKCDVRCANCHRRRTAKQFGWYQDIDMETLASQIEAMEEEKQDELISFRLF